MHYTTGRGKIQQNEWRPWYEYAIIIKTGKYISGRIMRFRRIA